MTRRRRAVLLLGLALLLGTLAASDVARREAALREAVGPQVAIVVAARDLRPGDVLDGPALTVRRLPARYAPDAAYDTPAALGGARAAVPVAAGTDVVPALVDDGSRPGPPVGQGERVAELVARASPELVVAGGRVDVLVTRDRDGGAGGGQTAVALEDVEVLSARPAPEATGQDGAGPRVAVALRTTLRQAVYLAAAESFAREIRLLPRAVGDTERSAQPPVVDAGLG